MTLQAAELLVATIARWQGLAIGHGPPRAAAEVAVAAARLCLDRDVLPDLVGGRFVTEAVIPPMRRSVESAATIELITIFHGPVVVQSEHGCATLRDAVDLALLAQQCSVDARGWAPIYVRLWREALGGG